MSIYNLKPRFQSLLRPFARTLHRLGVTANQVTTSACLVSVLLGCWLFTHAGNTRAFALIALWMPARMALNAVDGMLAREFGQRSRLGAMLNELGDVLSDAALYLPFAALPHFDPFWIGVVIVLSGASEFAGALGTSIGASRRYDGPMGKSDRALVFGLLGLWVAFGQMPAWIGAWAMPPLAALIALTTAKRVRGALAEAGARPC